MNSPETILAADLLEMLGCTKHDLPEWFPLAPEYRTAQGEIFYLAEDLANEMEDGNAG